MGFSRYLKEKQHPALKIFRGSGLLLWQKVLEDENQSFRAENGQRKAETELCGTTSSAAGCTFSQIFDGSSR